MDRISDSGSDGCGSIPHEGTEKGGFNILLFQYPYFQYPYLPLSQPQSAVLTAPFRGMPPTLFVRGGCHRCFDVFNILLTRVARR